MHVVIATNSGGDDARLCTTAGAHRHPPRLQHPFRKSRTRTGSTDARIVPDPVIPGYTLYSTGKHVLHISSPRGNLSSPTLRPESGPVGPRCAHLPGASAVPGGSNGEPHSHCGDRQYRGCYRRWWLTGVEGQSRPRPHVCPPPVEKTPVWRDNRRTTRVRKEARWPQ